MWKVLGVCLEFLGTEGQVNTPRNENLINFYRWGDDNIHNHFKGWQG